MAGSVRRRWLAVLAGALLCALPALVLAQGVHGAQDPDPTHGPAPASRVSANRALAQEAQHAASAEHGAGHGAQEDHGAGQINWAYGFLGEKAGVEPSLLWRPKGMPVPFSAVLLNSAILFFVLAKFGAPAIRSGLLKRKESFLAGMHEATRMKEEAEARLNEYRDKLEHVHDEIERVKQEMRAAGESERARILAEAVEQRTRMERDARLLVDAELKAAREALVGAITREIVQQASELIAKQVGSSDQQRLAEDFLSSVKSAKINSRGGSA